jgi:hypothetical protein
MAQKALKRKLQKAEVNAKSYGDSIFPSRCPKADTEAREIQTLAGSAPDMSQKGCSNSMCGDKFLKRPNPFNIRHCCSESLRQS